MRVRVCVCVCVTRHQLVTTSTSQPRVCLLLGSPHDPRDLLLRKLTDVKRFSDIFISFSGLRKCVETRQLRNSRSASVGLNVSTAAALLVTCRCYAKGRTTTRQKQSALRGTFDIQQNRLTVVHKRCDEKKAVGLRHRNMSPPPAFLFEASSIGLIRI